MNQEPKPARVIEPALERLDTAFCSIVNARPDAPLIWFEGRSMTRSEFARAAFQVAGKLKNDGVSRGSRVCIIGQNSDCYLICVVACLLIGAVATPLNWRGVLADHNFIIEDSEASLVLADQPFFDQLQELDSPVGIRDMHQIVASCMSGDGKHDVEFAAMAPLTLESVALQIYTSGTTGRPKGAMLTHGSMNRALHFDTDYRPAYLRIADGESVLISLPLFHIGGLEFALRYILNGGHCVIQRQFSTGEFLDLIDTQGVEVIGLVPTMLSMILKQGAERNIDFSNVKTVHYGAAPIPADLLKQALEVIGADFVQSYGLSETGGGVVFLAPSEHDPEFPENLRSTGRPMPGVELRIETLEGKEAATDEPGEILLRGSFVMKGYWKLESATSEAIDKDGWFHTGDIGTLNERGLLFIKDRKKEMIVSGGENIYPAELESALYNHPYVADVAVVGIPDDHWGEKVHAAIVLKDGCELTYDEFAAWARERVAGFKIPASIEIVSALPLGPSGKVLRREIRAPFWNDRERLVN
ncbi:MAG: AMP-binding protein [Henriciella sp.]|uniref:AMP-binding protein n=1 Tax=Henriciella sp. TaxID=1968823 RepID=UPI0032EEFB10